jgi:glycerol kinase
VEDDAGNLPERHQCGLAGSRRRAQDRPRIKETTAMGPAYRAGLRAGFFPEPDRFGSLWQSERRFTPQMDAAMREQRLAGWASAIRRLLA